MYYPQKSVVGLMVQPFLETGQEFIIMGLSCVMAAIFLYLVNLTIHLERIDMLDAQPA